MPLEVSLHLDAARYERLRVLGEPVPPTALLDGDEKPPLIVEAGLVALVRKGGFSHRVQVPWQVIEDDEAESGALIGMWLGRLRREMPPSYSCDCDQALVVFTDDALTAGIYTALAQDGLAGVQRFIALTGPDTPGGDQ